MNNLLSIKRMGWMRPDMLWTGLRYVLSGGLRLTNGHRPAVGHDIPKDFVGVGVASGEDAINDQWVLAELEALGIRHARLDFSYGDLSGPAGRLLEVLIGNGVEVMLHLVQPADEASRMTQPDAQQTWAGFVEAVLQRFGGRLAAVEIGSTINRRRWAGYEVDGFFAAWRIAHDIVRRHGVTLAGPNVTDFEPLYNIAVLDRLAKAEQLPDMHTNNLFVERIREPECFDHRVLRFKWTRCFRMNLIKKARLLRKITADFGVAAYVSPAAFWTLPRIFRLLPDMEQKQADYLTRYFVLCAASGAMRHAFWGPLVCAREGLVDDGSGGYPALERITHYKTMLGKQDDFRRRPAFYALRTFQKYIPGSHYERVLQTAEGLEVHAFRANTHFVHVIWTADAHAIALKDLYAEADLQAAKGCSRDGETLSVLPDFATESTLYLVWPPHAQIDLRMHKPPQSVLLYRHHPLKQAYRFESEGWQGALMASNPESAAYLSHAIHPERLPKPAADNSLRMARNAIWRVALSDGSCLVAKRPLKMHLHKRLLDRFRPSKARRSWDAAAELQRRGIPTAAPVAYIEAPGPGRLFENYYLCEFVPAENTVREMMAAFSKGAGEFMGIPEQEAYRQLCALLLNMHYRGVFFRDLSGGNILLRGATDGTLDFTLIDINRARFYQRPLKLSKRLSDLTRICSKLYWPGREALLEEYLQSLGKRLTWRKRLPFYLYDAKVWFKRHFGRKAIRRLYRRIAGKGAG